MIRTLSWYGLALFIFVLDQASKYIAQTNLSYGEVIAVMPGFNWTLLYNTGAAFSFLAEAGGWQRWFFIILTLVIAVVLIIWIARIAKTQIWLPTALALVLGGAFGNLYDRILLGHVVDFIQWYYQQWYWPAFNIADAAICTGGAMLILDGWVNKPKDEGSHDTDN